MSTAQKERQEAAELPEGDVIAVLLDQHARIRELFSEVRSVRGAQRRRTFDELRALLAVHETAEEMIVRPAAKRAAGEREAAARNEEEKEANRVLSELEGLDVDSEWFESRLADFERSVSDHADSEEREEFPALRRECSEEERRTMGKRLLRAERNAPTRPHPAAAGSPAAQWAVGPFAALVDRARDAVSRSGT